MDHTLLYGPAGTGKTTIVQILAAEMGAKIHESKGSALTRAPSSSEFFEGVPVLNPTVSQANQNLTNPGGLCPGPSVIKRLSH